MEERKQTQQYQREIRCTVCGKLLGKYDGRIGVINITLFCPKCRHEYTFTIKATQK